MEFVLGSLDSPTTQRLAFDCLFLVVKRAKKERFSPFVDHVARALKNRLDQPPARLGGDDSTLWNSALELLSGLIQAGCDIDHHIPLTFALSLIDNSDPTVRGSYALARAIGTRHPDLITSKRADMVADRVCELARRHRHGPLWTEVILAAGWLARARGAELPESWAVEVASTPTARPPKWPGATTSHSEAALGQAARTIALLGLHHAAELTAITPTALYLIPGCVTLAPDADDDDYYDEDEDDDEEDDDEEDNDDNDDDEGEDDDDDDFEYDDYDNELNESIHLGYARLLAYQATHRTDDEHQSFVLKVYGSQMTVGDTPDWLVLLRSFITHMDRYHRRRLAGDDKTTTETTTEAEAGEEKELEASVRAGFVALVARVRPEELADQIRSKPKRKLVCRRILSRYLGPHHPFVERSCAEGGGGGDPMATDEDVHRADEPPPTLL